MIAVAQIAEYLHLSRAAAVAISSTDQPVRGRPSALPASGGVVRHPPRFVPGAVIGDAAVPVEDPVAEQAVLTDAAVDRLAQQVGMTGMAGRLLDQMQEDPPQGEVLPADGLH